MANIIKHCNLYLSYSFMDFTAHNFPKLPIIKTSNDMQIDIWDVVKKKNLWLIDWYLAD